MAAPVIPTVAASVLPERLSPVGSSSDKPSMWRAVHRAIQSLGHLSNFLPTGTALLFQFLLPLVSDKGKCSAIADKYLTGILLVGCAISCCAMCFTDTYTAADGVKYYGIATAHGLWIPASPSNVASSAASACQYKLRLSDFVHASLSVVVFTASSLFDREVKGCYDCSFLPDHLQSSLPIVGAFLASLLLLLFPSTRHGFDEPPIPF